ncbi:putative acylamide-delta3desaturase [Phaeomoniella chlamydospora]|uniref:Putative acylamide-delta3desaturase n=1 Tax=Phaeomoniella chlamydospora TaxID=158046 RepID=A0A0G2ENJ9_PHACM|nr:putative acylamide-delta3desaturase [Phaeomoniella chlamydospora]
MPIPPLPIVSGLTGPDMIILKHLLKGNTQQEILALDREKAEKLPDTDQEREILAKALEALNDEHDANFQPTVFLSWDVKDFPTKENPLRGILDAYIKWASSVARRPTDVVFVTHLILYFTTTLPSAIYLFHNFTWAHGMLHTIMTAWYSDPLMGHTWNSYYYHHVKHHHVEGNGPNDLSSTIRLQRDEWKSLAYYVGRFAFLIWFDLPMYFIKTNKRQHAFHAAFWELASWALVTTAIKSNWRAALFVFVMPFCLIRLGLMIGNFGQHAFVDEVDPDSDYRSSITLIDVPSNRFCFNDGYHTAHHLNPLRHWRDQPLSFIKGNDQYVNGRALVFRNIDYLEITYRLMRKDYDHLARCLVPISQEQRALSHEEVKAMLRRKTRRFSEEEIREKWKVGK